MKCSISTYYKILDAELYNYDDGYMKLNVDAMRKVSILKNMRANRKRALRICVMCLKKR